MCNLIDVTEVLYGWRQVKHTMTPLPLKHKLPSPKITLRESHHNTFSDISILNILSQSPSLTYCHPHKVCQLFVKTNFNYSWFLSQFYALSILFPSLVLPPVLFFRFKLVLIFNFQQVDSFSYLYCTVMIFMWVKQEVIYNVLK